MNSSFLFNTWIFFSFLAVGFCPKNLTVLRTIGYLSNSLTSCYVYLTNKQL